MTHWVICRYEGKIYAGVDKLGTGPRQRSHLSATGFMPGVVQNSVTVSKLVKFQFGSKSCVICCASFCNAFATCKALPCKSR